MAKCDVLQKILEEITKTDDYQNFSVDVFQQLVKESLSLIKSLCEDTIAEKVELKGQRASDKVPTAYIQYNGDDFIVSSPTGNPDETYFTDNLIDAINTYFDMREADCVGKVVVNII